MELVEMRSLHPLTGASRPIYQRDSEAGLFPNESLLVRPEEVRQSGVGLDRHEVTLEFLTPTRIKHQGKWINRPTFAQLITAIIRRAELLSLLYGDGAGADGVGALLAEAESIRLQSASLGWYEWERTAATSRSG